MADIEKVKQAAKLCTECNGVSCRKCPYDEHNNGGVGVPMCGVVFATDVLTVIEQLQPKKGHWEMKEDPFGLFDEIPVCSVCGCTNDMRKKTEFCEHCGADMREGDGDGNHS